MRKWGRMVGEEGSSILHLNLYCENHDICSPSTNNFFFKEKTDNFKRKKAIFIGCSGPGKVLAHFSFKERISLSLFICKLEIGG